MHQCLSCNQPCSLLSTFCDACRTSLLARHDQVVSGEQAEAVEADVEDGHADWKAERDITDFLAFPQPEAVPVGSQAEPAHAIAPLSIGENGAWSFETSSIYTVKTLNDLNELEHLENKVGEVGETRMRLIAPRRRRTMPKNVRRALLVFCIVGLLALLTDGILLAMKITRHPTSVGVRHFQPSTISQQEVSPTAIPSVVASTGVAQVSLLVLSAQHLVFNATQGQTSLIPQTVTLSTRHQGFSWQVEPVAASPTWLTLSEWQGSAGPDSMASFVVNARPAALTPGSYTASTLVRAFNAQGTALVGSPVRLTVALTVHPACVLNITPAKLSFAAVLLAAPSPQTLTLTENSTCAFPVSWQVSADESWVTFASSSGVDTAPGSSIVVQASSANQLIGTYTAHITFRGTDSTGVALIASPTTITVTLTVLA